MKKSSRILSALLAVMFVFLMLPMTASAAETFEITEFDRGYWGPKDTPLLVILVNFDPSLDGETGESGEVMLKHKDHSYWYELLFGDGPKGLKAYYETQSQGNFRFIPAQENFEDASKNNKKNDGIVEVSVENSISSGTKSSTSDPERYNAVAAAVQSGSVDFSVYDKDGNGIVDESELIVVFIAAGYESTRSGNTPSYNAHALSFNYTFNGVKVATDYTKVGEMMNPTTPLTVGSFCHELGHNLGNGDLYAAGATGPWGGYNAPAGGASVMGATGGGSAGKMPGELSGESPSNFDPYHLTVYGLMNYENVSDGTYTLYSRQSGKGTYNILKISTPNPNEYYLIENRYFDESSDHFDATSWQIPVNPAILIWHVDQGLADAGRAGAGMRINSKGTNADIGVAALAPKEEGDNWNPATPGTFNKKGQIFDCRAYQFPGSGTWNTSLSDAEAENYHLKIEILSEPGHEMSIKVTGALETVSPRYTLAAEPDFTKISVSGQITDLNNQTLTSLTLEASESEDFSSIAASLSVKPDAEGRYEGVLSGLKEGTYYFTRVVLGTKGGDYSDSVKIKTRMEVQEDTTTYNINFHKDPASGGRPYAQKADVGEPVVVKFPMKKTGYVFAGWYTDAEYTEYFEIGEGKNDHQDIDLYAKWVPSANAAKLTVVGAKLLNDKADPSGYAEVGDTFKAPVPAPQEGKEFLGWYADEALTTLFDFKQPVSDTAEVKIYAKWSGSQTPPENTTVNPSEETTTSTSTAEGTTAGTSDTSSSATTSADNTTEPAESNGSGAVIGIVIAVIAIAAIGVVVVIIMKKKK